ncbi:dipicolinate synthase subunit DpsA [Vermiculatibacterium agrestimuris]|uniref:dipicolinate synthase subunit DpsA n=1 Tax=Vermiculatibacterium agrestimuris TaxID=2941519 RepID=UPI00203F4765|nr:dipicolinate synthase subunit DpsA [Vermiculatibacterium agrestimuris]
MRQMDLWVIGGDPRQATLARSLREDGHTVHTYALERGVEPSLVSDSLEGLAGADCAVLPLPALEGDRINAPLSARGPLLSEVLDAMAPGALLCAGMVSPVLAQAAEARSLRLVDYLAREELAVANAVPTSEGAIQIAMEELPITLHGAKALVIGYGRLGKVLSRQLRGLGAAVSVAARSCTDLAWAQVWSYGVERSDQLSGWLCAYDLVINTVPAPVLGPEELGDLKPGCLVIDLASKPGGVDFSAAAELGVKAIWALSLPGKVAPVTAGLAIKNTVYNILTEFGV